MAKDLNKYYSHFNWGPFIAKFTCPKNVLKRLDAEGKQAERRHKQSHASGLCRQ